MKNWYKIYYQEMHNIPSPKNEDYIAFSLKQWRHVNVHYSQIRVSV